MRKYKTGRVALKTRRRKARPNAKPPMGPDSLQLRLWDVVAQLYPKREGNMITSFAELKVMKLATTVPNAWMQSMLATVVFVQVAVYATYMISHAAVSIAKSLCSRDP